MYVSQVKREINSFRIDYILHLKENINLNDIDSNQIHLMDCQPKSIPSLNGYLLGFYSRKGKAIGFQVETKMFLQDQLFPIVLNISNSIIAKDIKSFSIVKILENNFVDFSLLTKACNLYILLQLKKANLLNNIDYIEDSNIDEIITENPSIIFDILNLIPEFKNIQMFAYTAKLFDGSKAKVFALPINYKALDIPISACQITTGTGNLSIKNISF